MAAATKRTAAKKKSTRKYSPSASKDVETEMKEMKKGTLKSGTSGKKVTDPNRPSPSVYPKREKRGRRFRRRRKRARANRAG